MGKKAKAPNPRKVPKTQADVDRAYNDGIKDGSHVASVIMMTALLDKFNAGDHIADIWSAFEKLSIEVIERRVTIPDLQTVLREEYGLNL